MSDTYTIRQKGRTVERVRIFKNNQSRAIRLPKALDFSSDVQEVDIIRVGNTRVIVPAGQGWATWFDRDSSVTDDFMAEREQPDDQERDALE